MKTAGLFTVVMVGGLALIVGAAFLNGIMLSYMWEWFIVPFGVLSIGVPQAVGIAALVSMLTFHGAQNDEAGDPFAKMSTILLAKLVVFGIAYGVSFAMPA